MSDYHNCPECGKRRVNTPSGSVCPDGHGRIHPRVEIEHCDKWQSLEVPMKVAECPECMSSLCVEISGSGEIAVHCEDAISGDDALDESDDDWPEESHHYSQSLWQPVIDKVRVWLAESGKIKANQ